MITLRQRVIELLSSRPVHREGESLYVGILTATEMSKRLGCKLSSLSSILKKMCDEGVLFRWSDSGPMGGYVYGLSREETRDE